MADLGLLALVVAFVVALFGIAANLIGAQQKRPALIVAGRNALYVVSGFVALAALITALAAPAIA